jgi:hypothetical protein
MKISFAGQTIQVSEQQAIQNTSIFETQLTSVSNIKHVSLFAECLNKTSLADNSDSQYSIFYLPVSCLNS